MFAKYHSTSVMPAYLVAGHSSQALHLTFAYVRIYIHAYIAFYSVGWCIHYHLYCTYLALFILLTVCKADDLFILHQQAVQRFWAENIPWSRLRKAYVRTHRWSRLFEVANSWGLWNSVCWSNAITSFTDPRTFSRICEHVFHIQSMKMSMPKSIKITP